METKEEVKKKIMLIGGHLTPALAVLDELVDRGHDNFVFVGRKYAQVGDKSKSVEFKKIKERGIRFLNLNTGRLQRKWTWKTTGIGLSQFANIPLGFGNAVRILLKEKPAIIVSFGGYLAVPLALAANFLRVPVVTHEQTVVSGLANRTIGKLANKVLISWDESRKYFPAKKIVKTGNPIRNEVFEVQTDEFKFDNDLPVVYVTGGSQGANTINWRLLEILPKLLKKANVIHQTGTSTVTKDNEKALKTRKKLPIKLKSRYYVRTHIYGKEIGEVFKKADLVVSRSGANTMTDLLALGKPSILIPIPWTSGNEQFKNAKKLEKLGIATIITQDEITPELLYVRIVEMLDKIKEGRNLQGVHWSAVEKTGKALVNKNAAAEIVDEIEKLI